MTVTNGVKRDDSRLAAPRSSAAGFTLIELLVALVVSGVMMASLVALSGSFQRSFGRTKDLTELQANLRFAMRQLVEDFSRIGYMASPNPSVDCRHPTGFPRPNTPALQFNPATNEYTLRGNYSSSTDFVYLIQSNNTGGIVCRSKTTNNYAPGSGCGADPNMLPFGVAAGNQVAYDTQMFNNVFCNGTQIRMDIEDGNYALFDLQAANAGSFAITLNAPLNRQQIQGFHKWINPVSTVTYQVVQDGLYNSPYGAATPEAGRWSLLRSQNTCNGLNVQEVADFLMPAGPLAPGGFHLEAYRDSARPRDLCTSGLALGLPTFAGGLVPVTSQATADPLWAYALVLTLRGRTETEDPDFVLGAYGPVASNDYAIDLDGEPTNGLARVRVARTVVDLRSLDQERL